MSEMELVAEIREEVGKGQRRLRESGFIPAILYGKEEKPTPLKVAERDLEKLLATVGEGHLVSLTFKKGRKKESKPVLIKEVQRDPIQRKVLHVDFHAVSLDRPVTTTVTITIVGEGQRVSDGGVLQHGIHELEISCLPTQIPEHIVVDVSKLKIGDEIKVGDLKIPAGIEVLTPAEDVVVAVVSPTKAEITAETTAEEAAPATPAAAEGEKKKEEK